MMLNSVSSVRFCANSAPVQKAAENPLAREGSFSTKPMVEEQAAPKAKKSTGKNILKLVGGLALIAAGLVGLHKFGAVKILESTEGASFMKKVGHYVAKAGEFIGKYTYEPIAKLFSKG